MSVNIAAFHVALPSVIYMRVSVFSLAILDKIDAEPLEKLADCKAVREKKTEFEKKLRSLKKKLEKVITECLKIKKSECL